MINSNISKEETVFLSIKLLQKRVFGAAWPRYLDEAIQEYCKLINVENVELLQETNFKKHREIRPLNIDAIQDEIADLLIYVYAVAGITFEDYNSFMETVSKKVEKNNIRKDWEINNDSSF